MQTTTSPEQISYAATLFAEGKFHKAIAIYESILKEHPRHTDALNDAALAYAKIGRAWIAQTYLQKALDVDPSHANAFFNLIDVQLDQNDRVGAALTFHEYDASIPASSEKELYEQKLWPVEYHSASLLDENDTPNDHMIKRLQKSWGNETWSANLTFATKMLELAGTQSAPILECGSGFTTLLLGYLAEERDIDVWVFEHHEKWHAYMQAVLERHGLNNLHLCHTPLCSYGDFAWYDVSEVASLPDAFGLVICDGPPSDTEGGRYGLLPVMQHRLAPECTILLDDVQRKAERDIIVQWEEHGGFTTQTEVDDDKQVALLSRSDAPASSEITTPAPQGKTYPPRADVMRDRLAQKPDDTRTFFRAVELLAKSGFKEEAAEVFTTYQANVPESPRKEALREALFDYTVDPTIERPGPICIGGCGSSGTNLLRRILDTHSQIACGKEMSVFDRPGIYQMNLDELRRVFLEGAFDRLDKDAAFVIQGTHGSYCGLKLGNHGDYFHTVPEVLDLFDHADSVADFFDRYLLSFAQKRGKATWAEKSPNNILYAREFLDMYPRGRFIQMIRDGRDVCLSLIGRRNFDPYQAITRWTASIEAGLRVMDHDRVYTIRYEDLVRQPEATLKSLFEWLDMPYEPEMLNFTKKNEKSAYGYAEQPIHSDSAFRWKRKWSDLSTSARELLDLSLEQHLIASGYKQKVAPQGDSAGPRAQTPSQVSISVPSPELEASEDPDLPPIFVGGAGRSGTKLVRAILNAHPNIAISHELKLTPLLAHTWHNATKYESHLLNHFYIHREEIDDWFASLIQSFLQGVKEKHGTKRVGEKTPNNALVFNHLNSLFPESPLIHIIRDGRDVVRSLLDQDWVNQDDQRMALTEDAATAAKYWVQTVQAGRAAAHQNANVRKKCLEIRYEDLVTDPESIMRTIIDHVGEPWDDQVLHFHEQYDPIHPSVQRPISPRSVGSWRDKLSAEDQATVKQIAGDLLIELGYAKDMDW